MISVTKNFRRSMGCEFRLIWMKLYSLKRNDEKPMRRLWEQVSQLNSFLTRIADKRHFNSSQHLHCRTDWCSVSHTNVRKLKLIACKIGIVAVSWTKKKWNQYFLINLRMWRVFLIKKNPNSKSLLLLTL